MTYEINDYLDFINSKIMEYLPPGRIIRGDDVNFRCPFCGDSKKSALKKRGHYSLRKGVFHCFNCDTSTTGLKLLQLLSGSSFDQIKEEYIKLRLKTKGISYSKKSYNQETASGLSALGNLTSLVKPSWKHPLSESAKEYLSKRKVLEAPFFQDEFYSWYDKNQNEFILIPWKINSIGCYYQLNDFLKLDKYGRKYIFPSKVEKSVFGLDNVDLGWNKLILFEGVYDSLFVKNGLAIGGKTLTDYQYKLITERYPKHQLILSLDNDESGLKSVSNIIQKYPSRYKFFKWFGERTKAKDINDYILEKNDVNLFSDKKKLDRMIVSSLEMKIFLSKRGIS